MRANRSEKDEQFEESGELDGDTDVGGSDARRVVRSVG